MNKCHLFKATTPFVVVVGLVHLLNHFNTTPGHANFHSSEETQTAVGGLTSLSIKKNISRKFRLAVADLSNAAVDIRSVDENTNNPPVTSKDIDANKILIPVNNIVHKKLLKTLTNNTFRPSNDLALADGRKRYAAEKIFRSGFGLEPLLLEKSKPVWMENGVLYRPVSNTSSDRASRIAGFEPYVAFNKTLFFPDSGVEARLTLTDRKIILWHTPARYTQPLPTPSPLRFCPDFPCLMTTDKAQAKYSAMLVFNAQRVGNHPPRRASPDQIFLFHNQEPPLRSFFHRARFHKPAWISAFNWTMTYRADSTIPSYYGLVRKHPDPPRKDYRGIVARKSRLAAWMVSHCGAPSRRDAYVAELRKYVDVDIYGDCGKFKCDRSRDNACNSQIAENYKFYLAFENGICPDYITEKFFRFMPMDVVTVARASNQFHLHASSKTFINTADFVSPRKLAEHLVYLDNNDDEYIKILQEKDQYIYLFEDFPIRGKDGHINFVHYHYESVPFCQACQKLWNLDSNRHTIPDIQEWFDRKPCEQPEDLTS